jgi:hypothetical protein
MQLKTNLVPFPWNIWKSFVEDYILNWMEMLVINIVAVDRPETCKFNRFNNLLYKYFTHNSKTYFKHVHSSNTTKLWLWIHKNKHIFTLKLFTKSYFLDFQIIFYNSLNSYFNE